MGGTQLPPLRSGLATATGKDLQKYNSRNYNQENKLLEYELIFSEDHARLHLMTNRSFKICQCLKRSLKYSFIYK